MSLGRCDSMDILCERGRNSQVSLAKHSNPHVLVMQVSRFESEGCQPLVRTRSKAPLVKRVFYHYTVFRQRQVRNRHVLYMPVVQA
jgi:hypothetical protein